MRVVVTGAKGFIGSRLVPALAGAGHEALGLDRHGGAGTLRLDLARDALEGALAGAQAVIHLAAEPGVRSSWDAGFDACVRDNLLATRRLLQALAAAAPDARLVLASSSSVYAPSDRPLREDAPLAPSAPYGVTKLATEHLARAYAGRHGLDLVVVRPFTVYGPGQRPDMLLARAAVALREGTPLRVFGDGGAMRDFTFVDDVTAALLACAELDGIGGATFNLGAGRPHTVADALGRLARIAGQPLALEPAGAHCYEAAVTWADTTAAREHLGWEAATTLEDGLARQWATADVPCVIAA